MDLVRADLLATREQAVIDRLTTLSIDQQELYKLEREAQKVSALNVLTYLLPRLPNMGYRWIGADRYSSFEMFQVYFTAYSSTLTDDLVEDAIHTDNVQIMKLILTKFDRPSPDWFETAVGDHKFQVAHYLVTQDPRVADKSLLLLLKSNSVAIDYLVSEPAVIAVLVTELETNPGLAYLLRLAPRYRAVSSEIAPLVRPPLLDRRDGAPEEGDGQEFG